MDNALFFSFNEAENPKDYSLLSMKLQEEVNSLSHLSISFLFTHPRAKTIIQRRSTFVLTDDDNCLFMGKVLSISRNMSNEVSVEVEDFLGFLRDIIRPGYDYMARTDSKYSIDDSADFWADPNAVTFSTVYYVDLYDVLKPSKYNSLYTVPNGVPYMIIDNEDEDVQPVEPPVPEQGGDYGIYEISTKDATHIASFKNWLSVLYDDVNAEGNGVIIPKVFGRISNAGSSSVKYTINSYVIYYNKKPMKVNANRNAQGELTRPSVLTPDFEYGVNLLDFEVEPAVNDPTTAIAPSGMYKWSTEDQGRLVMRDKNYSDYCLTHAKALEKYGRIEKNIDFSEVGIANTYTEGQTLLNNVCTNFINERLGVFSDRITVTGIAPYWMGGIDECNLLSLVYVVSPPHDVDIYDYCLSRELDFFDHKNDRYIIGPFIPANYFDYKSTNAKRKAVESIIANGEIYKRETGGLYTDNSYVRAVQTI
jgi:hypothetical protein